MKKKHLLGIVGLGTALTFGVLVCTTKPLVKVNAEDTPTSEVQENETSDISQVAKDVIAVITNFLSQPLVIGGISTTVGALAIFIVSKAIGGVSKRKLNNYLKDLEDIRLKVEDSVNKKDYEELVAQRDRFIAILKEIEPTIKNVKVRENCEKLLKELEPVKVELEQFVETEKVEVVEETKKIANDIDEILNN